jgi:malic enzyme
LLNTSAGWYLLLFIFIYFLITGLQEERLTWVNNSVSDGATLLDAVIKLRPTVLLGLSAQANVFTEEIVRTMARQCKEDGIKPVSEFYM